MARTTTTIIRTTRNSGGSRRRSGRTKRRASTSRKRTSRAKPRKTRFTTTKQQRTAYKESANKTNYLPLLGLAGLLGLGVFLLPRLLLADDRRPPGVNPVPGGGGVNPVPGGGGVNPVPGGGGGGSPGGFVHPPAGTRATVNATVGIPAGATPGLNLRASPSPTGALVVALPNGTPITVVQSNVVEQGRTDANKERWWQVTANGRTGFLRAVGPGATANAPYVWNVSFSGQQTATGYMAAQSYPSLQPNLQANYTQVFRGYDAYNRPVDQFGQLIAMDSAFTATGQMMIRIGDLVTVPSVRTAKVLPPEAPQSADVIYRIETLYRNGTHFAGRPYSWSAAPGTLLRSGQSPTGLIPRRTPVYELISDIVRIERDGQTLVDRRPQPLGEKNSLDVNSNRFLGSPGGFVHPQAGTRATVNVNAGVPAGATPGLNLRTSPSPSGMLLNPLPNGSPITVVQSNIVEQGRTAANKERWWQVTTGWDTPPNGRTGYVRAVGPGNLGGPYVWNVSFPGQQTATGFMQSAAYPDPYQALVTLRGPR